MPMQLPSWTAAHQATGVTRQADGASEADSNSWWVRWGCMEAPRRAKQGTKQRCMGDEHHRCARAGQGSAQHGAAQRAVAVPPMHSVRVAPPAPLSWSFTLSISEVPPQLVIRSCRHAGSSSHRPAPAGGGAAGLGEPGLPRQRQARWACWAWPAQAQNMHVHIGRHAESGQQHSCTLQPPLQRCMWALNSCPPALPCTSNCHQLPLHQSWGSGPAGAAATAEQASEPYTRGLDQTKQQGSTACTAAGR